jgi:hypothetical protein
LRSDQLTNSIDYRVRPTVSYFFMQNLLYTDLTFKHHFKINFVYIFYLIFFSIYIMLCIYTFELGFIWWRVISFLFKKEKKRRCTGLDMVAHICIMLLSPVNSFSNRTCAWAVEVDNCLLCMEPHTWRPHCVCIEGRCKKYAKGLQLCMFLLAP